MKALMDIVVIVMGQAIWISGNIPSEPLHIKANAVSHLCIFNNPGPALIKITNALWPVSQVSRQLGTSVSLCLQASCLWSGLFEL